MAPKIDSSLIRAFRSWLALLPIVVGMLILTSLAVSFFPEASRPPVFGHGAFVDTVAGAALGSLAIGHPSAGYLLACELLASGVTLGAVTALLVSWVTVGIVHLPAESLLLGRRFALLRNLLAFMAAVAIGCLVPLTLRLIA